MFDGCVCCTYYWEKTFCLVSINVFSLAFHGPHLGEVGVHFSFLVVLQVDRHASTGRVTSEHIPCGPEWAMTTLCLVSRVSMGILSLLSSSRARNFHTGHPIHVQVPYLAPKYRPTCAKRI